MKKRQLLSMLSETQLKEFQTAISWDIEMINKKIAHTNGWHLENVTNTSAIWPEESRAWTWCQTYMQKDRNGILWEFMAKIDQNGF